MTALFLGALIAALALVFVLWPLLLPRGAQPRRAAASRHAQRTVPHDAAVRALREIEFDQATGKLSPADYEQLKAEYTTRALAELRATDAAAQSATLPPQDLAEAMVQRARSATVTCGACDTVAPEPDAAYCSTCGAYLRGECAKCNAPVKEPGARFCIECGWELAA